MPARPPTCIIQDAYLNIYLLKDYAPLIAHPYKLSKLQKTYAYYFLTYPTLLGGFPNDRGTPSILMDVRDIKTIIQTLEQKLPNAIHPSIYEQVTNIQFRFYHLENDKFGEITNSNLLPIEDPDIGRLCKMFDNRHFPSTSMLMPGCIQIVRNNNESYKK